MKIFNYGRPMNSVRRGLALAIAVIPFCAAMRAVTVAEHTAGTFLQSSTDFRGQSFTTAVGAFNSIAINFFTDAPESTPNRFATNPYATGIGFLFSAPVLRQTDVNSMSPGFLGQAAAAGGFWTFDPSMILLGGTQYHFYIGLSSFVTSGGNYEGGTGYILSGGFPNQLFQSGSDFNFRVTGNHVPDAGMALWLFALGAFALTGWHRLTVMRR